MRGMTRADLWFSLVLLLLGVGVVVESWRMPRLENLNVNPYSVPGLVPGLIGTVLVILALVLLGRSVGRMRNGDPGAPLEPLSPRRLLLTASLTLVYAAVLIGTIPFWLATFLFVSVFIWLFEREGSGGGIRPVATAALQGALTAAVVTAVFRYVFLVRLP